MQAGLYKKLNINIKLYYAFALLILKNLKKYGKYIIIWNYNPYNKIYNLNYDTLKKNKPKVFKTVYGY